MTKPNPRSESSWAELLKEKRAAAGWSQRELGRRAGVHQPQIVRAERGDDLQLSVLARIAAPLGLAPALASMAPAAEDDDVVQPNLESWRRAWPQVDPQVFAVLARLTRLGHHIERSIASLAAAQGLNSGEVMVLGALRRTGPPFESTPTGLKERLWISLPGLKKRLDRLVARGLVERVDNPLDRRGQMVRMTARGDQTLDRLMTHPAPVFKAVRALPEDERRRLSNSLRRLLQQLEGGVEGPFDGPA